MRKTPGLADDLKDLSVITVSACIAGAVTVGALFANATRDPAPVRYITVERSDALPSKYTVVTPLSGVNRLYGTVTLRDGSRHTGFLRWDRNEGSWADLLEATRRVRGSDRLSGVRFGHVARIDVLDRDRARFTLKSGEQVELRGHATDLGSGLRALRVTGADGGTTELRWGHLRSVDFGAAPDGVRPSDGRLYGTLTTRSGEEFTGYVAWDVDEIYSSDVLDGDVDGRRLEIPFGAIAEIERLSSRAARVVLHSGEELVLDGTKDVNASNDGISVSDPALGQVKMAWTEFERVRFHGADHEGGYDAFDGGAPIRGTVVTRDGERFEGEVRWDDDESATWEQLDGSAHGVDFQIELANVAAITRDSGGVSVELRDGRVFELSGSNDVGAGNDGIVITREDGSAHRVDWRDFAELRLTR